MNIADILRAVARPAVTVIFAATIAQVVTQGIDAPEWFLGLAIPVILWWFGERTVGHVKEKVTSTCNPLTCPLSKKEEKANGV